ncbi:MAG: DUF115 domain-containing protein [Beijerinckiaceae bacterium]|nr:DUF115 domain-containing protein [Beijerinckiaceae bacterium]
MKTAIYVLYQRHEFDQFRAFFAQVLPELCENIEIHILINDKDCLRLRGVTGGHKQTHVHCEGRNLGVAGGRNYLVSKASAAGSEFLVSCDTDIIFSKDYFTRLRDAYMRLHASDPNLGYVQPILMNGPRVTECIAQLQVESWDTLADTIGKDDSWRADFWHPIKAHLGEEKAIAAIFHTGVSNIWRAHFDEPMNSKSYIPWSSPAFVERFRTTYATLRSDPKQLAQIIIAGKPVRIMSTAGGVTAFHIGVLHRTGGYNDLFNPFAFEDSELGFRSTQGGLNNYLLPDLFAIHDIFLGDNNRTPMYQARIGVLRGAEIAGSRLDQDESSYALTQSLLKGPLHMVERFLNASAKDAVEPETIARQLPSFLTSYYWELFRGLLDAARMHSAATLPNPAPIVRLLMGFVRETPTRIEEFAIPLGGADLRSDFAEAKVGKSSDGKPIYALALVNCRIHEDADGKPLTSRFFDLFARIEEVTAARYRLTLDVQSNEITHSVKSELIYQPDNAAKDGILALKSFDLFSKKYDYGEFSTEDIYPAPSLSESTGWLPMILQELTNARRATSRLGQAQMVLNALEQYLTLKAPKGSIAPPKTTQHTAMASKTEAHCKKKILIFADSRGQHKPAGCTHDIFAERLAKDARLQVDVFLCPMKWTTTLDFLEQFPPDRLAQYDHVILFTGIVDWSPRPAPSARADLYDNQSPANSENLGLNTRDYSKKIINNKKSIFDRVFGAQAMATHFAQPFDTVYEGQQTINMYGLAMAREHLIPLLCAIPNLIFVTANRFVPEWEGDFKRGRPANIRITEQYSDLFATALKAANVALVDLRDWTPDTVKTHTCDNLHLTKRGSDYIYERLMDLMKLDSPTKTTGVEFQIPDYNFAGFGAIERVRGSKRAAVMQSIKCEDPFLASLIIGIRHNPEKPERLNNLRFLLRWIDHHYGDLFDVLLIEQDSEPRLNLKDLGALPYVRHAFIYNPDDYNRGWCYNVAVRHHCPDAKVVALMDTDVLTGPNFLRDIMDCHGRIDVASPYLNIYYTDAAEARKVQDTMSLSHLGDRTKIKNPVTVAGGIVIWNRAAYMAIKGFEQYVGYSCEDRAMDVAIFNQIDKARSRIAPQTYVHLYHDIDRAARSRFREIYAHLTTEYGCSHDKSLTPFEFIHKNCQHVGRDKTVAMMLARTRDFGDPELYRRGDALAINGVRLATSPEARMDDVIFPPDFKGLSDYAQREAYANTPAPDSEELMQFYNRFKGQRCFIIGNGPSLNKHDLSLLENEYSFGVNSFYYKTRESGFRPTFYVVEDSSVMKENIAEIRAYEAPFKFFPTIYRNLHAKTPNTFFFHMNRGFYEKTSPNYAVPRFSTDASKVLYCGQSVTYINLQLAFFMGFTEVYLIGMDFDYVIPESHKRNGDVLLSDTDDTNHFHKDYFGKGKTWKDPKLDRVAMNYRQAKISYEAVGRRIYNATVGGHLEIFPRVDYEILLRDPKTGNNGTSVVVPTILTEGEKDSWAGGNSVSVAPIKLTAKADALKDPLHRANLVAVSAEHLVLKVTAALLTHRDQSLKQLAPGGQLHADLQTAITSLTPEHELVRHYRRAIAHVTGSA